MLIKNMLKENFNHNNNFKAILEILINPKLKLNNIEF